MSAERVALPAQLFDCLLPEIEDLAELKLTLFCLFALQQKDGDYRYLDYDELLANERLMTSLTSLDGSLHAAEALARALEKAARRGTLLEACFESHGRQVRVYFLNDVEGRASQRRLAAGQWQPDADDAIEILPPRPTLYGLYEENIGPLTPMLADAIREAEADFPYDWIEDAMRYAVQRDARNWRYIRKVLDSWQREGRKSEKAGRHPGRHAGQDGQEQERRKQYTAGEWRDFIQS